MIRHGVADTVRSPVELIDKTKKVKNGGSGTNELREIRTKIRFGSEMFRGYRGFSAKITRGIYDAFYVANVDFLLLL
jgi:peptidoglycan hydrolase-like amidase